ncbi:hypothetical protein [Acinetobacter sp. MD2]|uniref:hypothetical protein n=1 Tax=Acinetobacter sp. MD2 TaxID=2600066 RepID=UPI002D1EF0A9|nr:hypothetical protein [Acinetobacter sp. MD2]MEB3766587.1 hypothetical protein [Acinetobacter sp. MD2]
MQTKTLFLLQAEFKHAATILAQLQQIARPTDPVVLMAEAALWMDLPEILTHPLYLFKTEAELLGIKIPEQITVLDYAQFSDLLLQHSRCISLK